MDETFAVIFTFIMGCILGGLVGSFVTAQRYEEEAMERGHMVQCLGKTGYFWECDE